MQAPSAERQAIRQRRYRERIARRECVVEVTVGEAVLDFLVRTGWLLDRDSHRRDRIGDAIARALSEARYP
jgi:hypothetical protein